MTPEQQAAFDEVQAAITNIKDTVANSLNLQANGGYHIRNLAIALEKDVTKLETLLNAPAPEPATTTA